jgi:hypothetical protein
MVALESAITSLRESRPAAMGLRGFGNEPKLVTPELFQRVAVVDEAIARSEVPGEKASAADPPFTGSPAVPAAVNSYTIPGQPTATVRPSSLTARATGFAGMNDRSRSRTEGLDGRPERTCACRVEMYQRRRTNPADSVG